MYPYSSPKKRKVSYENQKCVFCGQNEEKNILQCLNPAKSDTFLLACKEKKDEISNNILANEHDIRSGELSIYYHKSCRSKYLLPYYTDQSSSCDEYTSPFFTRSKTKHINFNWKQNCFICGEKCLAKKRDTWSLVQSSTNLSSNLYSKIYEVAEKLQDDAVLSRLLSSNGDLVAVEARYHRKKGCLAHYISERNIASKLKDSNDLPITKTDSTSSLLREVSCIDMAETSHSETQPEMNAEEQTQNKVDNNDDIKILHRAAEILLNRVSKTKKLDKEYFSPEEITIESQRAYLDPLLLTFVNWLSNKKAFESANDISDSVPDQKVTSVCSDLTALMSNVTTPKHLGLTIYLHHTYGSKKLIEDLSAYGHTLPYSEIRHFLTSAAVYLAAKQVKTPSGAFVPMNVQASDNSTQLILAAADNWDHNERTLSGKRTTHAMTSLLVTPKPLMSTSQRLPRVTDRSLNISTLPGQGLAHVLPYNKPSSRPRPVLNPSLATSELRPSEPESARVLRLKELLYNLGRSSVFVDDRSVTDNILPPWTVFQSVVERDNLEFQSHVVFNPIIMAPPNDYSTVYTTLKRVKEQLNALGQNCCPVYFDMGLLSKALEVVWANPDEFKGVFPLEGGMHFLMCVFASIGTLYSTTGIADMLCESDVYAKATIGQIFAGKDFDRGMRAFLLIDETLQGRFMANFKEWLVVNSPDMFDKICSNLDQFKSTLGSENEIHSQIFTFLESHIVPLIETFRSQGRAMSPLFQFWDDYLTHVSAPLKLFIASSRHGLWDAHLFSKFKFLPLFFASNRHIYSRYMTYLVLQMSRLPPEMLQSFLKGHFVAKLTNGNFNSVWIDYVLEATENKALKSSGGIIGLTHQDSALARWFLSRPLTAEYSLTFKNQEYNSDTIACKPHHTNTSFHKLAFNTDAKKLSDLFTSGTFIDPFGMSSPPTKLVNFATGVEASADVQKSLLEWYNTGKKLFETFAMERFVVNNGTDKPIKSFHDPVQKSKVMTMSQVMSKVKSKSKEIPIDAEDMYFRLLSINTFKKVSLERVMSFENSTVPLSLFTQDGMMCATKKSDFMAKLEELVPGQTDLPCQIQTDTIIFDAMAVVQMQQLPPSTVKPTYCDMASKFWKYILDASKEIPSVHVVFDNYFAEGSLKSQTRQKRGQQLASCCVPTHLQPNMVITDWKHVLSSGDSKKEITLLYTRHITLNASTLLPSGKSIFVSGGFSGNKALMVKCDCIYLVEELHSNQEEADTRIILHAKYSSLSGSKVVIIVSPDTDVLILLIHHFDNLNLKQVFFKTGRRQLHCNNTRYLSVHDIVNALSSNQRRILLPVYCLTGCDSCSAFFGIGKKTAFKIMMTHASNLQSLSELGNGLSLSANAKRCCTYFVGLLYGSNSCFSLDKLRMEKALSNKYVKPKKLPPTDDSFLLHMLRCLFQLLLWKHSLTATHSFPPPTDYGFQLDPSTGQLIPQMMGQPAAVPELLSDLVCLCRDQCANSCICCSNEQPCTQACPCQGAVQGSSVCNNIFTALASVTIDMPQE